MKGRDGLFLIGWILATAGDMIDREPQLSKTFAIGAGKQVKYSTMFAAAAIVFFFIALLRTGD